jgi:hypothetical protein
VIWLPASMHAELDSSSPGHALGACVFSALGSPVAAGLLRLNCRWTPLDQVRALLCDSPFRCSDAGNKQVLLVAITTSCDCIMSGREGVQGSCPAVCCAPIHYYERGWRHVAVCFLCPPGA